MSVVSTRAGGTSGRTAQSSAAFVLHTYPFRETSLIVDMFTREHGRVGMIAKGARRPKSVLRGNLMAFQPMLATWSGKSELKILHRVEWEAGHLQLLGLALICGFYLNELLLKLLPREDPHEGLFAVYDEAIRGLRTGDKPARALRRFERELLREMGYALQLERDVEGHPVVADELYAFDVERGPMRVGAVDDASLVVRGKTLLDLSRDEPPGVPDDGSEQEGRSLMRQAIGHYLNGQELRTRQLLRELQEL